MTTMTGENTAQTGWTTFESELNKTKPKNCYLKEEFSKELALEPTFTGRMDFIKLYKS